MPKHTDLTHGLEKLKTSFQVKVVEYLDDIEQKWDSVLANGWDETAVRDINHLCHHLAGSGETFGFSKASRYGRVVHDQLNHLFDTGVVPTADTIDFIDRSLRDLLSMGAIDDEESLASANGNSSGVATKQTARAATPLPDEEMESSLPRVEALANLPVFIVEDDRELADKIVMELVLNGYDAHAVYDLADLEAELRSIGKPPGAIVMDVIFPDAVTGGIDLVNEFRRNQVLKAPVIFMSAKDSFDIRLKIIRAGGEAFYVKPFDVGSLIEKLERLLGEVDPDPLRVLIVDDDPLVANVICAILEEAGLSAKAINNPMEVIGETLEFRPDLVILDMYMPEVNGMEVAQILRQHDSCCDIPLLFLSAESDPHIRAAALDIGVDDFLVKPVDHEYLIAAVANRAQRARALGGKIYRDSLTRLLVHDEIKKQLADQVAAAKRYNRNLSYVLLDIDKFKLVNDTHGHLTGDHVIKSLAALLRRSFRRSDVVGRYGGEEFAVIMPDTKIADATLVLNRIREEFAEIVHRSEIDEETFQTTFSAGVSSFPEFYETDELLASADRALYEAKHAGRNRIHEAVAD